MSKPTADATSEAKRAKHEFQPSDFFFLRTPLLPFGVLKSWADGVPAPGSPEHGATLRDRLAEHLREKDVKHSLFVASPSLSESLAHWRQKDAKRSQKVEQAVVRYFERMSSRPTPFGLFSGCSVGRIGEATRLSLPPRDRYRPHSRLDLDYLFALCEHLNKDKALRRELRYHPNSSSYVAAGRLRYIEGRTVSTRRAYSLVAVDQSPAVALALEIARRYPTMAELAEALVKDLDDEEIGLDDALDFVDELIDSQIIVSNLEVTVTGREPIHGLIEVLESTRAGKAAAEAMKEARDRLLAIDERGLGEPEESYRAIAQGLEGFGVPVEISKLVQVDLVKPAPDLSLSSKVIQTLSEGVSLLHRMSTRRGEDDLSTFRKAFAERFEDQEIPLVLALDEESGIGYGQNPRGGEASPLLAGLAFGAADEKEGRGGGQNHDSFIVKRVLQLAREGQREWRLSDEDVKSLTNEDPAPLPAAFATLVTLVAPSSEAIDRGEYSVWMDGTSGPSGARMLGRFCHIAPELETAVREHLRREEARDPNVIFAEVVHLPAGRVGNVILRPVVRQYEITYLGKSEASPENQIPLSDLLVSVRGDRVVLRSRKLNKEVRPRLTSAHAYDVAQNLSTYRFLCALQAQGVAPYLGWRWGVLEGVDFLPRVTRGRLVLAKAKWRIDQELLSKLDKTNPESGIESLRAWARERGLPRFVVFEEYDHELPVDFENELSMATFIQLVAGRPGCVLKEGLLADEELCVEGPEGKFTHELLLPFVSTRVLPSPPLRAARGTPTAKRAFPPGSEWLFIKAYAGTATVEQILRRLLVPLRDRLEREPWFFVRYGDPKWHLRLRFRGEPGALLRDLLPNTAQVLDDMLSDFSVERLVVDTYDREVERYGGPVGIELAEKLFWADSLAVLDIVASFAGENVADARWRLLVRGVDQLMSDFGLGLEGKFAVMGRMRESWGREFNADNSNLKHQLSHRFRALRKDIQKVLELQSSDDPWLQTGLSAFDARSQRLAPIVKALKEADESGVLEVPLIELLPSYIHMFTNRLCRANARAQELVVYDVLHRHYESEHARKTKSKPKT